MSKTYTIKTYKNGVKRDTTVIKQEYRRPALHEPLEKNKIYAADTECADYKGEIETFLTIISAPDGEKVIPTYEMEAPVEVIFEKIFTDHAQPMDKEPSAYKQRPKESREKRKGYSDGRDGRRAKIPTTLLVLYNGRYDLPALWRHHSSFIKAVVYGQDSFKTSVGSFEVEIVRQMVSNNTSAEYILIRDRKIVRIYVLDLFNYFKSGLDAMAGQLLSENKVAIDVDYYDKDIEWFLSHRKEYDEYVDYAREDARLTRESYFQTVEFMVAISPFVISQQGILPVSAPGAAAKIAFSMASTDTWDAPSKWIQQMGADAYAGARSACLRPGIHMNLDLTSRDLKSAYPYGMSLLPDPCTAIYEPIASEENPILNKFKGRWGVVCIDVTETDTVNPSLFFHDEERKILRGVVGFKEKVWTTIPQMMIGLARGCLKVHRIHNGCLIIGDSKASFLKLFVDKMYKIKADNPSGSVMNLFSKLLLCSLYGKLVEVNCSDRLVGRTEYFTLELPLPLDLNDETIEEYRNDIYTAFVENHPADVDEVLLKKWGNKVGGDTITMAKLSERYPEPNQSGRYYLPLYAAQITGLASAMMGVAASVLDAVQVETDSVKYPACNEDRMKDYYEILSEAGYPAPEKGLGSLAVEGMHGKGVFVRLKLYAMTTEEDGKLVMKTANHGMSHMSPKVGDIETINNETNHELRKKMEKQSRHEHIYELCLDLIQTGRAVYETKKYPIAPKKAAQSILAGNKELGFGKFISEQRTVKLEEHDYIKCIDGYNHWQAEF